jgi:hypothetical protein
MSAHVPNEIYSIIFRHLADESNIGPHFDNWPSVFPDDPSYLPQGRQALVAGCASVNRLFRKLTRSMCWEHLAVRTHDQLQSFTERGLEEDPSNGVALFQRVMRIDLAISDFDPLYDSVETYSRPIYNYTAVAHILSHTSNLQVLVFNNNVPHPRPWLSRVDSRIIEAVALCKNLTCLQFLNIQEVPSIAQIALISRSCSNLFSLQLVNVFNDLDEDDDGNSDSNFDDDSSVSEDRTSQHGDSPPHDPDLVPHGTFIPS